MKRIAAVTFDLWDTLIQERPGGSDKVAKIRVAGIRSALSSAGLSQGPEEIMTAHEKTGQFLGMVWAKSRDLSVTDQVLFMLTSIDAKLPGRLRPEDLRRIEKAYSDSLLDNPPRLLPGAREALMRVKDSGYRIGLISNTGRTPGSTLRSVMERMDILEFFDTTTFSNEILVRKPAEGAFWTTLGALKAAPRAAVHVGDDPESDIMGARRVGMKAIQILADGSRRSPEADFAVGSLEHLPAILDNL
jgi:putative hydrolase of the HAD superfamily